MLWPRSAVTALWTASAPTASARRWRSGITSYNQEELMKTKPSVQALLVVASLMLLVGVPDMLAQDAEKEYSPIEDFRRTGRASTWNLGARLAFQIGFHF